MRFGRELWYCDWLCWAPGSGGGTLPNGVPQFAQNFALSGFANPQLGQFMIMPNVSDLVAGHLSAAATVGTL
jgi:hypothetical protein